MSKKHTRVHRWPKSLEEWEKTVDSWSDKLDTARAQFQSEQRIWFDKRREWRDAAPAGQVVIKTHLEGRVAALQEELALVTLEIRRARHHLHQPMKVAESNSAHFEAEKDTIVAIVAELHDARPYAETMGRIAQGEVITGVLTNRVRESAKSTDRWTNRARLDRGKQQAYFWWADSEVEVEGKGYTAKNYNAGQVYSTEGAKDDLDIHDIEITKEGFQFKIATGSYSNKFSREFHMAVVNWDDIELIDWGTDQPLWRPVTMTMSKQGCLCNDDRDNRREWSWRQPSYRCPTIVKVDTILDKTNLTDARERCDRYFGLEACRECGAPKEELSPGQRVYCTKCLSGHIVPTIPESIAVLRQIAGEAW